MFLHQLPDAKELFEVVAKEKNILPMIVEKDYWLMHLLWGLKNQGFDFAMKGGTSLSKGFGIIDRFSEDVDLQILPEESVHLKTGKNHDKLAHIQKRKDFFNALAIKLSVTDLVFERDLSFDDTEKMRNAGIRAIYQPYFSTLRGVKEGILLETGFDQVTPNVPKTISSWAYEKAIQVGVNIFDNRAVEIKCYCPEYTLVEKLQTISTKFRNQQKAGTLPVNFLRNYYDVYQLLNNQRVLDFIGTNEYFAHKERRFRTSDEKDLKNNPAFTIQDPDTLNLYTKEYEEKSALYFSRQPEFITILKKIEFFIDKL
jgi:predicted nucleotidyltransferase component of viral defense system